MKTPSSWLKQISQRPFFVSLLVLLTALTAAAQTDTTRERLEKAASFIRENRIAEAEQQLNIVLKATPNEALALNLLGTIRAQQGKLDAAEDLLTHAARVDPGLVPAHMNLAFLYLLKHAPEKSPVPSSSK